MTSYDLHDGLSPRYALRRTHTMDVESVSKKWRHRNLKNRAKYQGPGEENSVTDENWKKCSSLSGVPDFFDRNKILSGGDLSHYQVPHCIRVFFYFVWFVFIHHNFQFYFEWCTYCNILDIYLS